MRMALRLADPDGRYKAVRLASDLQLSEAQRTYTRVDGSWELEVDLPDVLRLEYQLELTHADGGHEWALDPGNGLQAPGAFGAKSVLELPGYRPPKWLDAERVPARVDELSVRARGLGAQLQMRVWSPGEGALRLLVANDGPEYEELSRLTDWAGAMIAAEQLPPFRVALLAPGDRDNWYSASAAYSRVLANDVLPAIRASLGVIGSPVGMGASLGALAMLHAQRRFPTAFGGLFLQSGSFFMPRHDAQERRFSRYARITRFVRDTLRDGAYAMPVPVTITCGRAEENLANNREMASALASQGYEVDVQEVLDMHNYTAWRDAFDPYLTALLRRAWAR